MDTQTTPSGIPYLAYLSGLNLGQGGQSGVTDPSLSGQPAAGKGGPGAGMAGGLGLDELSQLLAAQQSLDTTGATTGQSLLQGIGQFGGFGGLGTPGGGYGQAGGVLSQGQQQGPIGGQTGVAGQTGGSLDALGLIKQALGLVKAGSGLLGGQQGGYQTAGDSGGVSLSDQLRSGQAGVASPTLDALGQVIGATGTPDILSGIPQGIATVGQPQIMGFGSPDITLTSGAPGALPSGLSQQQADLMQQMFAQGATPDQVVNALQAQGFSAGEIPTGGSIPSGGGYATAGGVGDTSLSGGANLGGITAGGAQSLQGLISAIQALTGQGTDLSKALGTIQGLGGTASGGAALSDALGLTQGLGGAVGGFGAGAGALLTLAQLLGTNPKVAENTMGPSLGLESVAAPIAGSAAASAAAAAPAGSALAAVAPVLSAISGPLAFTGPILGAVMAILDATSKPGNEAINRFTGVQGPQTTQALQNMANFLPPGTDYSQIPTGLLEQLIPREGAALERFYSENLPEDRYLTGLQKSGSPELGQVQSALSADRVGLLQSIAQLQQRGIGNDVIGNLMSPQLNAISQMNNSDWAGVQGYQSPAALMQAQGLTSNEQLAGAYGGPTWLALSQMFGPELANTLSQYGIQGPQMNIPQSPQQALTAAMPGMQAQQYQGAPATDQQIATQYGLPGAGPTAADLALQYGLGFPGSATGGGLGDSGEGVA